MARIRKMMPAGAANLAAVPTLGDFIGDGGLDGIGDDVARDETVAHAEGAHTDAVGDGDGVKVDGLAAGGGDACARVIAEFAEVDVAGGHVAGVGNDGDLRFFEVLIGKAHCAEHGAGGSAVGAIDDNGGVRTGGGGLVAHG